MTCAMISSTELSNITPEDLQLWIDTGACTEFSEKMTAYLDRLELIRSMVAKYENPNFIVKTLLSLDNTLSKWQAQELISQAVNFFYCSNEIKKEAWRNIYAERLDNAAIFCWNNNDMEGFRRNTESAMKARRLGDPDKEDIPVDLLDRRTVIYQLDPVKMGIKKVSREELSSFIDKLNLSESQTRKLQMDGGIIDVEFEEDGQQDPE